MARPLRIEFEGAVYHIISRGNEDKNIFIDNKDYNKFLYYINTIERRYQIRLYCYCLMSNHYHLLIETQKVGISRVMHNLNGYYTMYFNNRHNRRGHLFQGRYKSILVEKENYLLELSRYIHLNPVRANVVKKPENYLYSSIHYYLRGKTKPSWLDVEYVLNTFGRNPLEQRDEYKEFIYEGVGQEEKISKNIYSGTILGSGKFVENITEEFIRRKKISQEVPHKKKLQYSIKLSDVANAVMKYYDTNQECLGRRSRFNRAKKIFVYLTRKYTESDLKEIRTFLGERTSISGLSKLNVSVEKEIEIDRQLKVDVEMIEKGISLRIG